MKNYIVFIIFLLVICKANAQNNSAGTEEVKVLLKSLELSSAPSTVILGLSPTDLESPKSKKGFMLSVVNSIAKNEGLPDAYSMEMTPFWLFPSKNMNALKFAGINSQGKQNIFSEVKKASFSFGFLRNLEFDHLDSTNPAFSTGFRTTLIKVRDKKNVKSIIDENNKIIREINNLKGDFFSSDAFKDLYLKCQSSDCTEEEETLEQEMIKKAEIEFNAKNHTKHIDKESSFKNLLNETPVFSLDFGSGYSTFFIDNQFKNNQFGKLGFWLVANIVIDFNNETTKNSIDKKLLFYGIARYMEDGTQIDSEDKFYRTSNYDLGGKAEFIYNKFAIGYEFIYRKNDIENTYRSNGMITYKVSDNVYINAAFGKNYGEKDNLITFLGLNWALDTERKSILVEKPK